jgi:hypothetical protein
MTTQLDMLTGPPTLPVPSAMMRRDDYDTSREAAATIERGLSDLQRRVLLALAEQGALTDEDLRLLPEFDGLAESTARHRRTDLFQRGAVARVGTKPNARGRNMALWEITALGRDLLAAPEGS